MPVRRDTTVVKSQEPKPTYEDKLKTLDDMIKASEAREQDNEDALEEEYLEGIEPIKPQENPHLFQERLEQAAKVDKKTKNVALERMVATIASSFVVIATQKLFGIENAMV